QGPIIMEAALQSGAKPETILMALAYGDQWTNMIQPFWALPLLGICRIKAGGLLGYTALILMISQLFFVLPLIVFA
ncbi:MAG: serine--pyruvate aminotransferase, partial [Myxococcales bacterium]|nr:serine--pyruvate aminotransferase [Myxococcales bacterium]